jgi:Rrf2 family iron-sulfur cluster assembly transcriptional regulator
MRLSAKSRHAVAAMIDLGLKSQHRPVALVDVLDDHDISLSYLEQIFSRLKEHQLVVGIRGPRGGYRLARDAESISVADIVAAVEDPSHRGRKSRVTGKESLAHGLWNDLSERIRGFLDGIPLSELLGKANIAEFARQHPRHFRDTEYATRRRAA